MNIPYMTQMMMTIKSLIFMKRKTMIVMKVFQLTKFLTSLIINIVLDKAISSNQRYKNIKNQYSLK